MTHTDALREARRILSNAPGGTFTPRQTREMAALEAEHPGIGMEAAHDVVPSRDETPRFRREERTVCEEVDYWADLRWQRTDVERPTTLEGLVALLKRAAADGTRIRMVGAARSDSVVSTPGEATLVASCGMGAPLPVLQSALVDEVDASTLYRCESGRSAKEVIDDLQDAGLALANMGSGQFQGIVGAIQTATHGSGLELPDMSGQTVAMQVVTFDDTGAVVVRQLARNGVFDPERFAAATADSPVPIELIEDEDAFLAAVVGLGCMGLVYSVTLAGVSQYWLHETREPERWSELKKVLLTEAAGYRNYEVLVSPLPREIETETGTVVDHECLVTRRALVDASEPSGRRPLSMHLASTPIGHFVAGATLLEATRHPLTIVPWMLHTGVTATEVTGYTDVSRKVLQLNLDLNAVAAEIEVPVEHTVAATDRILELAKANWAEMEKRLQGHDDPVLTAFDTLLEAWREVPAHTSPISLRFVVGTDAMLSMAHGGTRCMIEMPMPGNTHLDKAVQRGSDWLEPRELKLYEAYLDGRAALFRTVTDTLMDELSARPHWGLVNGMTAQTAAAAYTRWQDWLDHYDVANRFGVFNGPMTDQLGISKTAPDGNIRAATDGTAALHGPDGGTVRVVLGGDLAWDVFDRLEIPRDTRRCILGRKRLGASLLVSTAGPGTRAMLVFDQDGLRPTDAWTSGWKVASRTSDVEARARLANGVLTLDDDVATHLRELLGRDDEEPVRLHVLSMEEGRLALVPPA